MSATVNTQFITPTVKLVFKNQKKFLKYTWFTAPSLKGNTWLCRLMAISTGELVLPVLC